MIEDLKSGLPRPKPPACAAWDDDEFVQPAFQVAVEERDASRGGEADEFRHAGVGREHIGPPSGEPLLEPIAQFRVERGQFVGLAQAHSIGRVDDHDTPLRRGLQIQNVALFQPHIDHHSRPLKCPLRNLHHGGIMIRRIDGGGNFSQSFGERRFAQAAPEFGIVDQQPLEGKVPGNTRRNPAGHQRGFEGDGSPAAHGIEQHVVRRPAGEQHDARRQIFPQRRFNRRDPVAAFEKWLAGGVQIEGDGALIEKGVQLDVRPFRINAGPTPARRDELVAHGVFDPESEKIQTGKRAAARADLDFDRLRGRKPVGPGERVGCAIDIVFRLVGGPADFPEDTARDVTLEIDPIHRRPGGGETDAAVGP